MDDLSAIYLRFSRSHRSQLSFLTCQKPSFDLFFFFAGGGGGGGNTFPRPCATTEDQGVFNPRLLAISGDQATF